jgi:segregation and condensation protein B
VGHRDVPGKPAMFGTTREFLDYFGLKKLEDLPPLAELKDGIPELSPQTDLIESLEEAARLADGTEEEPALAVVIDIRSQYSDNAAPASTSVAPSATSDAPDDEDDSDSPDFDDDEDYDVELDDEEDEDEEDEDEEEEDEDDERDDEDVDDDENETEDRAAAPSSGDRRPGTLAPQRPTNDPVVAADDSEPDEQESADVIPLRARASGDGSD